MQEDRMKLRRRALKFLAIVIGVVGFYIAPSRATFHTFSDLLKLGLGMGIFGLAVWIWLQANELVE
jgi:hypothetical protein